MQEQTPQSQSQSQKSQYKTFHKQGTNFTLDLTLNQNQSLKIKLCDYNDWVIYERQFMQEDIGRQIHRKVDLGDLYYAVLAGQGQGQGQGVSEDCKSVYQSQQCTQLSTKKTDIQQSKRSNTIITQQHKIGEKIKNKQRKFYKIQNKGKITIYCIGHHQKTKQIIYYQSKLTLNKIKQMLQSDIISVRLYKEKKECMEKYQLELEKIRGENAKIVGEFGGIKGEIRDIKQEMLKIKEEWVKVQGKFGEFSTGILEKVSSLSKIVEEQKQVITILKKQVIILQQKSTQNNPQIIYNETLNQQTFTSQPNFSKFKLTNNQIQYIGQNKWTQLYFCQVIPYNMNYIFKIKVSKCTNKHIMVGVIDYTLRKNQRSTYTTKNGVYYFGNGGTIYGVDKCQGGGFGQGQVVQICVNLGNKSIKWSVGGVQRASVVVPMFEDKNKIFVPCVQIYYPNNKIQRIY